MLRVCFAVLFLVGAASAAPVPQKALPVAPAPRAAEPDASLILVEEVPDKDGTITKRRLVRIGFRNGKMRPPETIWEGEQRFLGHFGGHHIARDRFLVTTFGGVIDLHTKKVINSEMHGHLDGVEGALVYYWVANATRDEGMFTFHLDTHEIRRVAKLGEFTLGLRSPSGTRLVKSSFSSLTVHENGKATSLGNGFTVDMNIVSSTIPNTPVLWLDDDRLLAQVKNGNLVAVDLKGKQTEVVKIPIAKNPVLGPKLYRDPTGRIIYECGDEAFEVDAKAKQWARIEWDNLGHGFQVSRDADPKYTHTFRHNGREIGKLLSWPRTPGRVSATAGYLAVTTSSDGSGLASAMSVRLWSVASGEWTSVKLQPNCLVGWVK